MRGGEKFYQRIGNTGIKTLQNKKTPKTMENIDN